MVVFELLISTNGLTIVPTAMPATNRFNFLAVLIMKSQNFSFKTLRFEHSLSFLAMFTSADLAEQIQLFNLKSDHRRVELKAISYSIRRRLEDNFQMS